VKKIVNYLQWMHASDAGMAAAWPLAPCAAHRHKKSKIFLDFLWNTTSSWSQGNRSTTNLIIFRASAYYSLILIWILQDVLLYNCTTVYDYYYVDSTLLSLLLLYVCDN